MHDLLGISQMYQLYEKCKRPRLGFELVLPSPFPTPVVITPWAFPELIRCVLPERKPAIPDTTTLHQKGKKKSNSFLLTSERISRNSSILYGYKKIKIDKKLTFHSHREILQSLFNFWNLQNLFSYVLNTSIQTSSSTYIHIYMYTTTMPTHNHWDMLAPTYICIIVAYYVH